MIKSATIQGLNNMSDFELHSHVVRLSNAASRAYAQNPDSDKARVLARYYETAHMVWSLRQFLTIANGV